MGRIDNLCAIEKIPGYEGTRLNVNDSMMGIGTIIAVPRGRYDTVSTTWFNSVPYSHGTIFPIPVNRDSGNLLTHTPTLPCPQQLHCLRVSSLILSEQKRWKQYISLRSRESLL